MRIPVWLAIFRVIKQTDQQFGNFLWFFCPVTLFNLFEVIFTDYDSKFVFALKGLARRMFYFFHESKSRSVVGSSRFCEGRSAQFHLRMLEMRLVLCWSVRVFVRLVSRAPPFGRLRRVVAGQWSILQILKFRSHALVARDHKLLPLNALSCSLAWECGIVFINGMGNSFWSIFEFSSSLRRIEAHVSCCYSWWLDRICVWRGEKTVDEDALLLSLFNALLLVELRIQTFGDELVSQRLKCVFVLFRVEDLLSFLLQIVLHLAGHRVDLFRQLVGWEVSKGALTSFEPRFERILILTLSPFIYPFLFYYWSDKPDCGCVELWKELGLFVVLTGGRRTVHEESGRWWGEMELI